jgi:molecular chaperone DnaJ
MGDQTAQRVINPGKMKEEVEREERRKKGTMTDKDREDHANEGFLKSAWHNITGQHRGLNGEEGKDEDEKKKGSGRG